MTMPEVTGDDDSVLLHSGKLDLDVVSYSLLTRVRKEGTRWMDAWVVAMSLELG